ncbi:phage portal protein [Geminicoccus flavidas]|uniref:phage portal protein n=1 Tax=Geminicoccus flavidas TaxID=2506407 RepID=UPI0013576E23|nr:phage portal protein [Geminicoccus flavidas]
MRRRPFDQMRLRLAKLLTRGLEAAGGGPRAVGWRATPDVAGAIQAGAFLTAARAQTGWLNDPRLARAVAVLVSSLVGSGYIPRSQHPNRETRRRLAHLFRRWANRADATGRTDFAGLCRLIVRSMIATGDGFARFVWTDDALPLRLQVLPSRAVGRDAVPVLANGHELIDGIEIDRFGRPVAYHITLDEHLARSVRVPAEEIVHVFDQLTPDQFRGLSWLAPVLTTARELDSFKDAALATARTAALFSGVITDVDGAGLEPGQEQGDGSVRIGVTPGSLWHAPPGKRVDWNDPPKLGESETFVKAYLRDIASGMNITYEQLSGDYEGVSYSSVRAGANEHRRWVEQTQYALIVPSLLTPVWQQFLRMVVLTNALPGHDLEELEPVEWLMPRFAHVDPKAEIGADVAAIQAGLKSREQVIGEYGYDVETIDAQIAADSFKSSEVTQ